MFLPISFCKMLNPELLDGQENEHFKVCGQPGHVHCSENGVQADVRQHQTDGKAISIYISENKVVWGVGFAQATCKSGQFLGIRRRMAR